MIQLTHQTCLCFRCRKYTTHELRVHKNNGVVEKIEYKCTKCHLRSERFIYNEEKQDESK